MRSLLGLLKTAAGLPDSSTTPPSMNATVYQLALS
jgi:hypothetical protein